MREIFITALVVMVVSAPAARAGVPINEVRAGVLGQGWVGPGSDKEGGVAINVEALFVSPGFLSAIGSPRPHIGATIATDADATSQLYAGLEWRASVAPRVFISGFLGGAIHNGETDDYDPIADAARVGQTVFYGCRAHFRLGGDVGYQITNRVSAALHYSHISNAGLCRENEGLDHLGVRLGYGF